MGEASVGMGEMAWSSRMEKEMVTRAKVGALLPVKETPKRYTITKKIHKVFKSHFALIKFHYVPSPSSVLGCGEPMDCETKMEPPGSPERELGAEGEGPGYCDGVKGGAEETEDSKKRKRKPYRPGEHQDNQYCLLQACAGCTLVTSGFNILFTTSVCRVYAAMSLACLVFQALVASWCGRGNVTRGLRKDFSPSWLERPL